jgi:hypothetical protein
MCSVAVVTRKVLRESVAKKVICGKAFCMAEVTVVAHSTAATETTG